MYAFLNLVLSVDTYLTSYFSTIMNIFKGNALRRSNFDFSGSYFLNTKKNTEIFR